MPRMTQLTVCLENKPGQLAKMTGALKRAKVNILAGSVADSTDTGVIRLVTDNPAKAKATLTRAGMKPTQQAVLGLSLPNKPGALADAAAALAAAGVNINYAYGSVDKAAPKGLIIFGVDDLAKALAAG
jgi:hypothetical protein